MASNSKELMVLATARARPGKEGELERALRDVAAPTRAQHGCLQFEIYRSASEPGTLTALERWSSPQDHQRHLQGDHVKTLMARFEGILAAPPEIAVLKPL